MNGTLTCRACGALNDATFGHCIRCALPLAFEPPPAGEWHRTAPRRDAVRTRRGNEDLLGRWPAETLPMAKALLTVSMLVFAVQFLEAWKREPSFEAIFGGGSGLEALRAGAILVLPFEHLVAHEPWRLLSACFVHIGILHLGMNMLGMMNLCRMLEPAIGSVRLLIVYVVTGVVGFAASVLYYTTMNQPATTAGASGAIFGLMGAILGFLFRRRDDRWKAWLAQTVFYSLMFGFLMPRINNTAHLAGLLSGAVLGWFMGPAAPSASRGWQRVLAALFALAVVASLVLARLSELPDALAALG